MVKIIVNPVAGQGRTQALWQKISRRIRNSGIEFSFCFTQGVGHATELAKETVKDGFKKIFVVGGDGTLNEVVNGIDLSEITIGVIPTGSGNDLGKMVGIKSIDDGLVVLKEQKQRRIDLGRARGRLFVNNLGIGLDALVANYRRKLKVFKGNAGYLVSVLKVLIGFVPCKVEIVGDEYRFADEIISISIGNGQFHGGCFRMTPEAIIDDGLLDICLVKDINKLKLLFNIPKTIRGNHVRLKEVKYFKVKTVSLSLHRPLFVHLDGEVFPEPVKEMKVDILPASLNVFSSAL